MDDPPQQRTLEKLDRPLIEPVYAQTEPNQPIEIGSFNVSLKHQDQQYHGEASIFMRFTPSDRLRFLIQADGANGGSFFGGLSDWDGVLTLPDRASVPLEVTATSRAGSINSAGASCKVVLEPRKSPVTITQPSETIVSVKVHLFNFPDFHGPEDYIITTKKETATESKLCGRVVLQACGWTITIAGTDKTSELHKQLKEQGGYVITHMARVERDDGSPFSAGQVEDLLRCLHYFLSFALGRWAGVALPVGVDQSRQTVYEQWGLPIVSSDAWNGSCSWFSDLHGKLLSEVFPGFWALWADPLWNDALKEALYWYLAAQGEGKHISLDTGVVLAQAALERIAWNYCVPAAEDGFQESVS